MCLRPPEYTRRSESVQRYLGMTDLPTQGCGGAGYCSMDLHTLHRLGTKWECLRGIPRVSVLRSGSCFEPGYHRAFQRLNQLGNNQLFNFEPVDNCAGEIPKLLRSAFELAQTQGLTIGDLVTELSMKAGRIRELLGAEDRRPRLQFV